MAEQAKNDLVTSSGMLGALKSPRSKRIGLWLLGCFLAFGILGYFAAPPLIKSIVLKQLSQELHRDVRVETIDINPYAMSARVAGLSIKAEGGKELAGFDELLINVSSASIFKMAVVVDEIRLQGLRLAVARVADGRYDVSDLLDEWMKPKEKPPGETPRFSVNNIQLIGGKIEFDDQPKGKVHRISEINLAIPFISSLPYQAEILVEPSFSAIVNGSPLALKGRSKPFAGRHESELDLDLDRFGLANLQPYIPESIPLRLNAGTLDTEMKVVFKELAEKVFSLSVVGGAHVSGLSMAERNGQPLLGWKRLDVDLENADLINQKIAVRKITLDGLDANLSVNPQGEFNILLLADQLAKPSSVAADASKPAKPLEWSLGEFVLSNGLIHWKDASKTPFVIGEVRELQAVVGSFDSKLTDPIEIKEASYLVDLGERLRSRMNVKGVRVDLPTHRVDIAEVTNSQTRARMLRNKHGQIEWVSSPLLKTIRATEAKAKDERPWIGKLAKLNVEDLNFHFEDHSTQPTAVQILEGLNLHGENLTNEPGKKGTISLKSKVNKKGSLNVAGSLQVFPLDVALKVETSAIPLLPLQPYFSQFVNVSLSRGQISNKGEATAHIDNGGFKAGYKGSVTMGDFLAVDKENSSDFLKWKSLFLGGIDFRLAPMAIHVGEIALSDFYSKLILSQAGRLNVQDIVRKPKDDPMAASAVSKPVEVKPEAIAAATAKPVIPIRIAKITLQNGMVNFSDFFVKPNYTVNVTKLGGRITNLSSAADTVADLDLRGSYANSAPVQILAKLNPLAAKSFLDMKVDISGIDLVGFSPYSGKYAGYNIEKGKLSLKLAYKLENKQLTAENRLLIDQFTFGQKVESPDATTLPVNLAISLLKNNRGEIDLNLPISGSLEDPQFSVGGLIVKVIVNLFMKAVSSPFALLGSMFGSGEELSNVEFLPGKTNINDVAAKKLENLSKALIERAALKLEITGRADPDADREGVKRAAMERAIKAEKLKESMRKDGEGDSLDSIEIATEEYQTYLTRAYKAAKFPKPRNMVGLQKDLPIEEMEKLMMANVRATDEDIAQLARTRAENVETWLIDKGKVPPERIFLVPPKLEADSKGRASRADFSLR